MNRLNIFNSYNNKDINHEDVLTRNFLLLVKNIPIVQIGFFELIRSKMIDYSIDSIALGDLKIKEIYTQVTSGTKMMASYSGYNILSVIISDDEYKPNPIVKQSERDARYDGLVICNPNWMFIIENKPTVTNIWEEQLNPSKGDTECNILIEKPCKLSWREVISLLNNSLSTIVGLEKTFVEEFLEYVNETYSWLNPYDTFSKCNGNNKLLDKRCADILKAIYNTETKYHKGWKKYIDTSESDNIVRQVALDYEDNKICLWMYAGDIMRSAKLLYEKINLEVVINLLKNEYTIVPNFHLSYRSSGLVWFDTNQIEVKKFIEYWRQNNNKIKQIKKEDISEYYKKLVEDKVIDKNDSLIDKILNKNYPNINVIPGCLFQYKWSLSKAIEFDEKGEFIKECKSKIEKIRTIYMSKQY